METKIGELDSVRLVGLIFGDLEIKVDGENFYNRIKYEDILKVIKEQRKNRRKFRWKGRKYKVKINYDKTITLLKDWIIDRTVFFSFGVPRHYNQIRQIEVDNSQ